MTIIELRNKRAQKLAAAKAYLSLNFATSVPRSWLLPRPIWKQSAPRTASSPKRTTPPTPSWRLRSRTSVTKSLAWSVWRLWITSCPSR